MLEDMETDGGLQADAISIQPYRYLNVFANGNDINNGEEEIRNSINSTGFFAGMPPRVVSVKSVVHNYVIYQTYEVNVEYVLQFPIKFLFSDEYFHVDCTAH